MNLETLTAPPIEKRSVLSGPAVTDVQSALPPKKAPWYKDGVIYEVHVRAFCDSDGDGTGDFRGLTSKLDYLCGLGITAIWLLPFYPSPLKDDGYDIADYCGVHPRYGTLADFKLFLREAHRRGLRVITELVLNHTSDQHPWFQRSRRARPGTRWRDYYVWSVTPARYEGTRVIFKDVELSNWAWDPVANEYYWHRFYSHQPDLNFDNPAVHQEMTRVVDFWLDLGVDGLRLDAVPYLYERDGTSCENLPETHQFLKKLRHHVDTQFRDRMLLAEANQWPDDAAAYFGSGKGDECHMAFHFPLMPRLFMALRMEDRVPIVDILQQTPAIPETSQWALFLRNHDELTLEMVTDEERDYMYRMYAHMQGARLNLGIRRRLAPLVGNDRKRIELLTALLFSLPGTPVIYYGDEIGMGENIYLGDRNGVRTPMQWSADKNAGFSRANPQSLYLPINLDPENHYEAVNVEVAERNPHSLLWSMKRLIALRQRWKAFGNGTLEFLHPENRKVLVCVRRHQDECLLVVANLSRFVQPVELDLSSFQGLIPVELFGRNEFPAITDKPYFLTLGPHGFYWFSLEAKSAAQTETAGPPVGAGVRAVLSLDQRWEEILDDRNRAQLERALQGWLPSRRWFGGKARTIRTITLRDQIPLTVGDARFFLAILLVDYVHTDPETYLLPLACSFGDQCDAICRDWPASVIAHVTLTHSNREGVLHDALVDKIFGRALLEIIESRRGVEGAGGELKGTHTSVMRAMRGGELNLEPVASKAEQSNSSLIYGDCLILKLFRKLDAGINPELEMARFLDQKRFLHTPALAGSLEYRTKDGEELTVAVVSRFIPGCQDCWEFTLDALSRFYERVQTLSAGKPAPALPAVTAITKPATREIPAEAVELLGTYLDTARLLGTRTAELHLTLACDPNDPAFAPEAFTPNAQRGLFQSMRSLARQNLHLLAARLKTLPAEVQPAAQRVVGLESEIINRFRAVYAHRLDAVRIRHHGDFHLGQVLHTGKDVLIIDFEGEPAIPISERRLKRSPLRDVAGMIRSFHYAAHSALQTHLEHGPSQGKQPSPLLFWARFWSRWVSTVFYAAYRQAAGTAPFLPKTEPDIQMMMDVFLLRKAIYELGYELTRRPDWAKIPLQGILELVDPQYTP